MKKTTWPRGKRVPKFHSYEDEVAFWQQHELEDDADEAGWEEVPREEGIGLDAAEVRALKRLARRRGLSVRRMLEQLVREGIRKAS